MSEQSWSAETPLSEVTASSSNAPLTEANPVGGGSLILVATPIGNLGDISARAIEALRTVEAILCEDTRVTAKLLTAHGITTPTYTLHDHNEAEKIPFLLEKLHAGSRFAVVSDAGTPLVSDPGFRLVRAAIDANIPVSTTPGPNAVITALTLSGLPPHPFTFLGFPPPKSEARTSTFSGLRAAEQAGLRSTLIWYEAPHRLVASLEDLISVFGPDRDAAVGRELTKRFEEMVRGSLKTVHEHFLQHAPRGEITLLIGPAAETDTGAADLDTLLREALQHHSVKDAASLVAGMVKLPKRTVYSRALELSREI
ncbi:tetrapyrrole/corrin/porphyrin methyltransferase [Neokomagataea thailandica NBRC 106555]|uniref:Ribosomal RNA small subunit methyltransferase I n=1 Tax=Neokomagataea thailandica NBRC 106555 TaxID=1223520 RepID=A0ABQ0QQH6_9PROT|nr:tetrapyrrole/corrin/porphyrin methyltransferase [Neokomagataea thailandica NBRC 106555]